MDAKLKCPRCGSADVKANGSTRFLCHGCGRTFSRSTSTVMSSKKLAADKLWLMVNMMVNGCKLKAISDAVGISSRTAYVWRMKVCAVAFEIQKSAMLSGKVWIDEKLVPVNEGMLYRKTGRFRLRGVSRNQAVIACGVDSEGNRFAFVAGRGHITERECIETYVRHIAEGSTIVHDGIKGHAGLIRRLSAKEELHRSSDPDYHKAMQPIDSFCSEIEHWTEVHRGSRTEYLRLNVAWIAFRPSINEANIKDKIDQLVSMCYQTKATFRVKDRYKLDK